MRHQLTIAKGVYHDGRTLKDDLSEQTYKYAKKRLPDLGLEIEKVETLKPWLLAMTFGISELQKLGYDENRGVDQYFYKKAKNDGKKVDGFETAEYQLDLFGDMPAALQEALLLQTMQELGEMPKVLAVLVAAWKSGDEAALDQVLLKSAKEFPDLNKALIIDRNKKWLPAIESLVGRQENVMIIVGAAHLVGKDGIIAALKQKGYQVEQR
ncbi:MAG: TraB/GumN family protein [Betaproteobacteria bacterium]